MIIPITPNSSPIAIRNEIAGLCDPNSTISVYFTNTKTPQDSLQDECKYPGSPFGLFKEAIHGMLFPMKKEQLPRVVGIPISFWLP